MATNRSQGIACGGINVMFTIVLDITIPGSQLMTLFGEVMGSLESRTLLERKFITGYKL